MVDGSRALSSPHERWPPVVEEGVETFNGCEGVFTMRKLWPYNSRDIQHTLSNIASQEMSHHDITDPGPDGRLAAPVLYCHINSCILRIGQHQTRDVNIDANLVHLPGCGNAYGVLSDPVVI